MTTILLAFQDGELSTDHLAQIQNIVPNMHLQVTQDRTKIESMLDDLEIAVCGFPHDLLMQAPQLRWFQAWHAGADWVLRYPELIDQDMIITNMSGVHAIPISEHILSFLLAFGRGLPNQIHNQLKQQWRWPDRQLMFELAGKTMLLIGVGAIGTQTAKLASAFGMEVWGVRRHPEITVEGVTRMFGSESLAECLPAADFVVLTIPLTPETDGLIGAAEFRLMKQSAYLINVGRGGTIDQVALIRALQEGQIAGAGLDVTDPEPLPVESPLWSMENVIITAHYSGYTPNYTARAMTILLDNLTRYMAGQPLRNIVDKRLGY